MRWFRKKAKPTLQDPRWQRFNNSGYKCHCCGKSFNGVFDISLDHPDPWPHEHRGKSGLEVVRVGDDKLSEDLCQFDEHRFVRAILILPIKGTDKHFGFGCWGSLSQENFELFIEKSLKDQPFDVAFSWLCNSLPTFETDDAIPCGLHGGEPGKRPTLEVCEDANHPLYEAQQNGITFDQLLDIYAKTGNDLRPHLESH